MYVLYLHYAYRPPRTQVTSDDEIIAQRVLGLAQQPNNLQKTVQDYGWDRKSHMKRSRINDFPRLTLEDFHQLTLGVPCDYGGGQNKCCPSDDLARSDHGGGL